MRQCCSVLAAIFVRVQNLSLLATVHIMLSSLSCLAIFELIEIVREILEQLQNYDWRFQLCGQSSLAVVADTDARF